MTNGCYQHSSVASAFVDSAAAKAGQSGLMGELCDWSDSAPIYQMKHATKFSYHATCILRGQSENWSPSGSSSVTITPKFSKSADFIDRCWLSITIPEIEVKAGKWAAWVPYLAHALIEEIDFQISSVSAQKLHTFTLNAHYQYAIDASKRSTYNEMIGNTTEWTKIVHAGDKLKSGVLYLPLPFWWCSPGQSFPVCMVPYNDLHLKILHRPMYNCILAGDTGSATAQGATSSDVDLNGATFTTCLNTMESLVTQDVRTAVSCSEYNAVIFQDSVTNSTRSVSVSDSKSKIPQILTSFTHVIECIVVAILNTSNTGAYTSNYSGQTLQANAAFTAIERAPSTNPGHPIHCLGYYYDNNLRFGDDIAVFSSIVPYFKAVACPSDHGWSVISFGESVFSNTYVGSGTNFSKLQNPYVEVVMASLDSDYKGQIEICARNVNIITHTNGSCHFPYY